MKRVFGVKKNKDPPPTLEDTSDRMNARGDRLDDKIKTLDDQLVQFREQIKRSRPGPAQEALKRRALNVLKQKRLYENQRGTLYTQQYNVEQTRFTMENIQDTVATVQAMKAASREMKQQFKTNKELNIDYIDKMQDNMYDLMDMANEINEAMGRSYDVPDDVDETDLMSELDGLEADLAFESLDAGKTGMPSYMQEPELPDVPSAMPAKASLEEELGLRPMAQSQHS